MCAGVTQLIVRAWRGHASRRRRRALLGALWFAAHPLHVEAVTGVVGRAELLCALCCLGANACHAWAAGLTPRGCSAWRRGASARRLACAAATLGCIAGAVLCKETGIVIAPILIAQEVLVLLPARGAAGVVGSSARICALALFVAAYLVGRILLMTPPGEPLSWGAASLADSLLIRKAENPLLFLESRLAWWLSVGWIQAVYTALLLAPSSLCIEYFSLVRWRAEKRKHSARRVCS